MHSINHNVRGIKLIIHGDMPTVKLDKFSRRLAEHFFDDTPSQIYAVFEGKMVRHKLNWIRQQYLLRYLFYTMKQDCSLCIFQHFDELRIWKRIAECMLINGCEIDSRNLRTSDDEPGDEDKMLITDLINLLRSK